MFFKLPSIVLVASLLVAMTSAIPLEVLYEPAQLQGDEYTLYYYPEHEDVQVQEIRVRRSPQPDTKEEEEKKKREQGWVVKPGAGRDEDGNVGAGVNVKRVGEKHDFEAGWNKVVRGPGRAKPTWHVGGTFRF